MCSLPMLTSFSFSKTYTFFILLLIYNHIICANYTPSKSVHSVDDQKFFKSSLYANESLDEDVIILSSWESLRIWSSNSTLHSSKILLNFDAADSDKLNRRKITAIDYYYDSDLCDNVFIWCDVSRQTIYSGVVQLNHENPYLTKMTKLLQMDFGNHIRLAVDRTNANVFIASYQFERIDLFQIKTNTCEHFLSNISRPVDIAIDSKSQVLFWIENWTCIAHIHISMSNTSITRMCSSKPRALAVDTAHSHLYWSDSDGNIFRKYYFDQTNEVVLSNKKMQNNYALDLSDEAIYMSDQYKLTSVIRSTLTAKVVLIESPGILDFKVVTRKFFTCQQQTPHTLLSNISTLVDYAVSNESVENLQNTTDYRLTASDLINNNNNQNNFYSKYFVLLVSGPICLTLICSIVLLISYCLRTKRANRNQIKRNTCQVRNRLTNDKSKLIPSQSLSKTVCIEDLGSFSNNGFIDQQRFCSGCPIRQTCNSCEDRDECIERGICLSTYKLLT